jgi:hypothetical protein
MDAPLTLGEYMKFIRRLILFTFFAAAVGISHGHTRAAQVNPHPQSAAIRILTPVAGQTLDQDYAEVHYELVRPALSDEPEFLVQLDGADPINTSETAYTFSDLQPGVHTVRVTLVDANNLPIQGGAATVQFKVSSSVPPAQKNGSRGAIRNSSPADTAVEPAAPIPPELVSNGDLSFSISNSPLPLLSLIGFGLLIGGAARTMRAR